MDPLFISNDIRLKINDAYLLINFLHEWIHWVVRMIK